MENVEGQPADPESVARTRSGWGRTQHGGRFWLGVLVVLLIVIVGFRLLDPRTKPCHQQTIVLSTPGSRATLDRCAPPGQHGGFFYGMPR